MPRQVFPPDSDLVRFDTRMPVSLRNNLVEIGRNANPQLSLNQIINIACTEFIGEYNSSEEFRITIGEHAIRLKSKPSN